MRKHRVDAGPDTVHWGFFDAGLNPLITIDPGDEVTISTVSGPPEAMPKAESGLAVPPALSAIHAKVQQRLGPHIMTGPIAVRGAKAGQVLEVRIKSIALHLTGATTSSARSPARCPTILPRRVSFIFRSIARG